MNVTKTMLKAIVLTQLMGALSESQEEPTSAMLDAVIELNASLEAVGPGLLDQPITAVWETLLAALETLEEAV